MSTDGAVHHPLFARVYHWLSGREEMAGQREYRRGALAGLAGRVVELGAGNGLNFEHYPDTISEVVAVEPEAYLRERAREAAAVAPAQVRIVAGVADALPLDDASCDAAVASLGFVIEHCRRFDFEPVPVVLPAKPRVLGIARRA